MRVPSARAASSRSYSAQHSDYPVLRWGFCLYFAGHRDGASGLFFASWANAGHSSSIMTTNRCLLSSLLLDTCVYQKLIRKPAAAPVGTPWLWTFAYGAHSDYSSTYGYAVDREDTKRRCGLPTPGWCIPINRGDQVSPETAAIAVG